MRLRFRQKVFPFLACPARSRQREAVRRKLSCKERIRFCESGLLPFPSSLRLVHCAWAGKRDNANDRGFAGRVSRREEHQDAQFCQLHVQPDQVGNKLSGRHQSGSSVDCADYVVSGFQKCRRAETGYLLPAVSSFLTKSTPRLQSTIPSCRQL